MKKGLSQLAILGAGILLLLHPEAASAAVRDGLTLCFRTVIPSLFPFFVVVSLLLGLGLADCLKELFAPFMGPMFRLRGICALPLLAGLLGGYPSGAKTAADLYLQGHLSRQEAELLLGFCDNCGPGFILGYVGAGILGSARAGMWLFLIHMLSALITGMVLCRLVRDRGPLLLQSSLPARSASFPEVLIASVSGALTSTLNISAFVVLFRVLTTLVHLPTAALGILEMVSGTAVLSPGPRGFVSAAAIVAWGGLCVHCQALSAAAPAGLSMRWHWIGKTMQAAVSVGLALVSIHTVSL